MKLLQTPVFFQKSSKRQYISDVCIVVIFLCGLVLSFTSCSEKLGDDQDSSGSDVVTYKEGNINFIFNFDAYGEGEDISMRSAADMETETVIIPLDDGLSMFATLRNAPAPEVGTRSAMLRSFNSSAEIHVVVYEHGGSTPVFAQNAIYSADATATNTSISRISPIPISLDIGKMYRLVAFTFNNNTPIPASYPPTLPLGCNPDEVELLWGVCDSLDITGPGTNNITITMKHLFSQVTVKASSSIGNITNIQNVQIPGFMALMSIDSGKLVKGTPIDQVFTGFTSTTPTLLTSNTRLVYTGGENTTIIKMSSVDIGGTTRPVPNPAIFSKQLKSGYKYDLEIKIGDSKVVTDDDPPPGFIPYVGAFWKANQTGERLIRIPRVSTSAADGTWSATVIKGDDWIMLDKGWTIDPGVYTSSPKLYGDSIFGVQFDTQYALPSGSPTVVTGTLRPNTAEGYQTNDEYIRFRIGLKSKYIPTPTEPARYGVVLLTYNNNNLRQRIFIRQGEDADFLMKPGDLDGSGSSVPDNRISARKFSPYNLTAGNLNETVDVSGASPSVNPGKLTDYPSQAGALFQWAGKGAFKRIGYDAHTNSFSDWSADMDERVWSFLAAGHEVCPPGYRRPNDGPEDMFNPSGTATNSEMRQSLFLDPSFSGINSTTNSVYGYYADGFFDRFAISGGTGLAPGSNCTVESGTPAIAHAGRLFYNPGNSASLFFPNSGYRHADDSRMQSMGLGGAYWSGTVTNADYAWNLNLGTSVANLEGGTAKSAGLNLRCVASSLLGTPRNLWLSPSVGNDVKNLVITSFDPWVVESVPTNISAISAYSGSGVTNLTVTRSTTEFGLQPLILRNTMTGELSYIAIDNYYIDDDETLYIPNDLQYNNTQDFEIFVDGGSESFTIVSLEPGSWIKSASIVDGKLRLIADQSHNMEHRTSYITLAHADDPTYQVTFVVEQDLFTNVPPFKFFVIWFTWGTSGGDVDIAVEFSNNYMVNTPIPNSVLVPFDNNSTYNLPSPASGYSRAMGYSYASHLYVDGTRGVMSSTGFNSPTGSASGVPLFTPQILEEGLMFWGGDALSGQGETVFFNAPKITPPSRKEDNTGLPREIKLELWAGRRAGALSVKISTYEGGKMLKPAITHPSTPTMGDLSINNYNFYNVDDHITEQDIMSSSNPWSLINTPSWTVTGNCTIGSQLTYPNFRDFYTHVATITYDRYRRTAMVDWHALSPSPLPAPIAPMMPFQQMTQEELDKYAAAKEAEVKAFNQRK